MLKVGIIGLPNVGKSTLFNALLKKQQALVANYPFATIEPNIGVVPVPDKRLEVLADIIAGGPSTSGESSSGTSNVPATFDSGATPEVSKRPPIKPATVEFVDIAGLVKGANEGAGLGNKFLSHIREVSIIAHVVRAFEDANIIKEGSVDPKSDYETIQTELMLADLQTLINSKLPTSPRLAGLRGTSKTQKEEVIEKLKKGLNQGIPARNIDLTEDEKKEAQDLFLLSSKPEIIVLNVSESDYSKEKIEKAIVQYTGILDIDKEKVVVISAKIEAELAELSEGEQKEYLKDLGLKESGLERLIRKAYQTLGLISFLTAGEKEVRAWTIRLGSTSLMASGTIHTDFEKKFIKAEVVSFDDFVQNNGWKGSREKGRARFEGRDYIIKDGDVVEFKIGV